jgi:hypothetical protein
MRLLIAGLLICAVLALGVHRKSPLAADDLPPARQNDTSARKTRSSDNAVVRSVVYGLEEAENRLYLTTQALDAIDRELKRTAVDFDVPKGGKVVELSLAKMGERHLAAVVKVQLGDDYDFHCLTFISPSGNGRVNDKHTVYSEKFYSTRDDLRILALSGKGNTAFVVLGEFDSDEDLALISKGVFYFTSCPWPPMGKIAPYSAKSAKATTD